MFGAALPLLTEQFLEFAQRYSDNQSDGQSLPRIIIRSIRDAVVDPEYYLPQEAVDELGLTSAQSHIQMLRKTFLGELNRLAPQFISENRGRMQPYVLQRFDGVTRDHRDLSLLATQYDIQMESDFAELTQVAYVLSEYLPQALLTIAGQLQLYDAAFAARVLHDPQDTIYTHEGLLKTDTADVGNTLLASISTLLWHSSQPE